jgi:hypothetical protein
VDRDFPTRVLDPLTVRTVIRSQAGLAWLILIALTALSSVLGADHGLGNGAAVALVIVSVAVFKVRLVGLYFMELRVAPLYLRCIFESYCVILFCLLTALYLMAG